MSASCLCAPTWGLAASSSHAGQGPPFKGPHRENRQGHFYRKSRVFDPEGPLPPKTRKSRHDTPLLMRDSKKYVLSHTVGMALDLEILRPGKSEVTGFLQAQIAIYNGPKSVLDGPKSEPVPILSRALGPCW